MGVMSLLDEECALPKGSEQAYVDKMHARFATLASYGKPSHGTKGTHAKPASAKPASTKRHAPFEMPPRSAIGSARMRPLACHARGTPGGKGIL